MKPEDIFTCRMCGDCCRGYGGTYVSGEDIAAIAAYIGCERGGFEKRYCQRSGKRWVLAQKDGGYCIFWDHGCGIHPVKPGMCRDWPFIRAVLIDPGNWFAMAASCPGMRTDATKAQVQEAVAKALAAMPDARRRITAAASCDGPSAGVRPRRSCRQDSGGESFSLKAR